MKRILLGCLAPFSVFLFSTPVLSAQTVASGFTIEEYASVTAPFAIAFPQPGSIYGTDLYVSTVDFGQVLPDSISTISPSGVVSPFASLLPEADPVSLEFPPPGSPYGDLLYVSCNNRDFGQPGDCGGVIQTVDVAGVWNDFTALTGCILCTTSSPPSAGIGEPNALAFPTGGIFGWDPFVGNSVDQPGGILRFNLIGQTSVFADDGFYSCSYDPGLQAPFGFAFGPGGAFGTDLFFGDLDPLCYCIRKADTSGTVSAPFASLPASPLGMRFGPAPAFDGSLFVCAGSSVYRVMPDGSYDVFAKGFGSFGADPIEFSPDGLSLYICDYGEEKIFRIRSRGRFRTRIRSPFPR